MKDQYFGDENDFLKYGLLRALTMPLNIRVGICWMLTESDGRFDGNKLRYLKQSATFRHHDPLLFDLLKQVVETEEDRRTACIETSGLLGTPIFHSVILTDNSLQRTSSFSKWMKVHRGLDMVFFDPDNGLEVKSMLRGRKDSCKYLCWDELCASYNTGCSIVVYQHFPRVNRNRYRGYAVEGVGRRS